MYIGNDSAFPGNKIVSTHFPEEELETLQHKPLDLLTARETVIILVNQAQFTDQNLSYVIRFEQRSANRSYESRENLQNNPQMDCQWLRQL